MSSMRDMIVRTHFPSACIPLNTYLSLLLCTDYQMLIKAHPLRLCVFFSPSNNNDTTRNKGVQPP